MTTYNTGNPIGSKDPRDLYDNAENFDHAINDDESVFIDRLGVQRTTLWQMLEYSKQFNDRGDWASGTPYARRDYFTAGGITYVTLEPHTSTSIAADLAAGNIAVFSGNSGAMDFLQAGTGAVKRSVESKLRDVVSVKDFGAVGDGVTDDTAAIQAAINVFTNGSGRVYFPRGTYKVTETITVAKDGIGLIGEGMRVTFLSFVPTADDICLFIGKGGEGTSDGGIISECSVEGLFFTSPNTSFKKTAIELKDCGETKVSNIKIGVIGSWSGGAGSIGIRIRGRQFFVVDYASVGADIPIVIGYNDNSPSLCADLFEFRKMLLSAKAGFPNILIENKVVLTNTKFSHVSTNGGDYCVKWDDSTAGTPQSQQLIFENLRHEQAENPNSFAFYLRPGGGITSVTFDNCRFGGGDAYPINGIYLRECYFVHLLSCMSEVINGKKIIDADETVSSIKIDNCFMQTGGISGLSSHTLIKGFKNFVSSGLLENGYYMANSTQPSNEITNCSLIGNTIKLAADGIAGLPKLLGLVVFISSPNVNALYSMNGSNNTVFELIDPTEFYSRVKGTAASINIYYSGDNARYEIENKLPYEINVRFVMLGTSQGF